MAKVYDVPAQEFISRLTEILKNEDIPAPVWSSFVKTGAHADKPPQQPDWWYTRCASILRKIYLHGPLTVNDMRTIYGDGKRKMYYGARHHRDASGAIIRNAAHALEKLGELSENQLSKISSFLDLKQALTGLICRSKFLADAQQNKIHESDQFQQEYKSHRNQTMISIVMKGLSTGSSSDTVLSHQKIRENYFIFRNELTLDSEITVDSLMVKTFIM